MSTREYLLNIPPEERVRLWELHKKKEKARQNVIWPSECVTSAKGELVGA